MKINTKNDHKKRFKKRYIFIPIAIVFVLVILCAVLFLRDGNFSTSKSPQNTNPTKSSSDVDQTNNIQKDPSVKTTTPNTDTAAETKTDTATGKSIAQMVSSVNISSGVVYIRGGINNFSVSTGSCYALLHGPNGQTIEKDTTLLQNASTTDCKTITINTSELTRGNWSYTLNYSSSSIEGQTDATAFTIN